MSSPHDRESVEYWRHIAEQSKAETALYRGMVGQMQLALAQLIQIWDAGDQVARPDLVDAFDTVRSILPRR
jgi:hypothetical protein